MQNRTDFSNYGEWKFMVVSFHVLKFESWVHKSAYLRWKAWSLCIEDVRKINKQWGWSRKHWPSWWIILYYRCTCTVFYTGFFGDLQLLQEHQSGCHCQFYRWYNWGSGWKTFFSLGLYYCPGPLPHTSSMHRAAFRTVMYSVFFSSILSPKSMK